jgi:hypothetical protein
MIAMRMGDGFDANPSYPPPPYTPVPGVFEPIAARGQTPGTPVDLKLPFVRPFTYASQSEYRPDGPLQLTSRRYAKDLAELKAYGGDAGVVGTLRTTAQTETVRFWAEQTFFQFNRTLRDLVKARGLDLRESARILAYANVATADTMIACWEAKYHYNFWRPTHAIQRADTDKNPATSPDANWFPLLAGNHPEYPSGHACFTAAVTESLHQYFGTKKVQIVASSTVANSGPPRTYESLDELVEDVENARVWGGLHFRTTMTDTAKDFPRIAKDVGKQYFLEGSKHGRGHGK